jgi:hypothetical protein
MSSHSSRLRTRARSICTATFRPSSSVTKRMPSTSSLLSSKDNRKHCEGTAECEATTLRHNPYGAQRREDLEPVLAGEGGGEGGADTGARSSRGCAAQGWSRGEWRRAGAGGGDESGPGEAGVSPHDLPAASISFGISDFAEAPTRGCPAARPEHRVRVVSRYEDGRPRASGRTIDSDLEPPPRPLNHRIRSYQDRIRSYQGLLRPSNHRFRSFKCLRRPFDDRFRPFNCLRRPFNDRFRSSNCLRGS